MLVTSSLSSSVQRKTNGISAEADIESKSFLVSKANAL